MPVDDKTRQKLRLIEEEAALKEQLPVIVGSRGLESILLVVLALCILYLALRSGDTNLTVLSALLLPAALVAWSNQRELRKRLASAVRIIGLYESIVANEQLEEANGKTDPVA